MTAVFDAARSVMHIDRSKLAPDVGLRTVLSVALILVVGRATGHTTAGVVAALGSLYGGFVSLQGNYRSRATLIMVAGAGMGLAEFVGATVGHLAGPLTLCAAGFGFVAGLVVALGPAASVVGIQAIVVFVVFSQFQFSASVAARNAGLIILGAAVQTFFVVVLWPLRRFPAERRSLGDAFSGLAGFARDALSDDLALFDPSVLDQLNAVMSDPQPFGGEELVARRAMAAQADRIRLELVALSDACRRLRASGLNDPVRDIEDLMAAAAWVLAAVATAARAGRPAAGWEAELDRVVASSSRLRARAAGDREARGPLTGVDDRAEALAGQLRTALRACATVVGGDGAAVDSAVSTGRGRAALPRHRPTMWLAEQVATLRSNLTLSSQSYRHALRLSVTLAAGVLVSEAFGLAHRYWVPMTVALVLRPDFNTTITRGLSRVVGTLVGAGLVTLFFVEVRPGPDWLIAIVIILCGPAVTLIQANYAIYSVCIASLVVTLLAFEGQPGVATAGARSLYTVIGAGIALSAYLLWPTWEASTLPETLAKLSEVEGRYARLVLLAWADPA
ncbi:MAG: FUSC family protein, partial [Acidimicrobiales bacterium]